VPKRIRVSKARLRVALLTWCLSLGMAANALAMDVLFPRPLHLTRAVEDPIAQTTLTIDEYYAGNRVVTISGARVQIWDYERQERIEIQRDAGTYSVLSFADMARAHSSVSPVQSQAMASSDEPQTPAWTRESLGTQPSASGQRMEAFTLKADAGPTVTLGVDRSILLSRTAIEVVIGAAFPNPRRIGHEAILSAARMDEASLSSPLVRTTADSVTAAQYALPVQQITTFAADGETLQVRNVVTRIRQESVPDALLLIPPGSRKVESHIEAFARELRAVDALPGTRP
jgi:hypothetical protein